MAELEVVRLRVQRERHPGVVYALVKRLDLRMAVPVQRQSVDELLCEHGASRLVKVIPPMREVYHPPTGRRPL